MAFLIFMIILHLYSDPCFGQPTMDDAATGMKCSKCIVGTKARESICSDCTRGGDNADKPFTCRKCDIGLLLCSAPSVPQPVIQSRRRPLLGPSPG